MTRGRLTAARVGLAALACLAIGLGALTAPQSASARARASFFGVQGWTPPTSGQFRTLHRSRIGLVRFTLSWPQIEPTAGARNWGSLDEVVTRAARNRTKLLPSVIGSPLYVAPRIQDPPRTASGLAAWQRFTRDLAARYGRNGVFWREHPGLPYVPITQWQLWNEPGFPAYWSGHPDPRQYFNLLKAGAIGVRAGDPSTKVIMAGLSESRHGIAISRFLRAIYAIPGSRAYFDAVAVHAYAANQRGVLGAVKRTRRTMRHAGDGRKPLLVSEIGWGTGGVPLGGTRPFIVSKRGQATRLKNTFKVLLRGRRRYHIQSVVWFSLKDRARRSGEKNYWGLHTGLFTRRGRAKPAWRTYRRIARHG